MAPEFARGEKLDINKILAPNEGVMAAIHYTSDPAGVTSRQHQLTKRKELFARHLFNLMMLLAEDDVFLPTVDTTPTAGDVQRLGTRTLAKELQIRRIAQWAVNVVDFGDADSVMTQFRYDANPFNAYDPFDASGNVITTAPGSPEEEQLRLQDLRTVWGMEHPELALTETLAFHDRRAEDSDQDPSGKTTTSPDNPDPHFDSIEAPEGSAFFELFCTRSPQPTLGGGLQQVAGRGPEDLWSSPAGNAPQVLNLAKIVGAAAGLPAKPVWRLAISEITENSEQNSPLFALQNKADSSTFEPLTQEDLAQQATLDPQKFQDPLQLADPMNSLRLRRFVWFVPPQTPLQENRIFFIGLRKDRFFYRASYRFPPDSEFSRHRLASISAVGWASPWPRRLGSRGCPL